MVGSVAASLTDRLERGAKAERATMQNSRGQPLMNEILQKEDKKGEVY